ncbi:MAG: MBL fold metallo-hydrolase [Polyangiaceae bacterium]
MALSRKALALRIILAILGVLVLTGVFIGSQMPKAGPPRLVASPDVVGVDTGGSYAWIIRTQPGAILVDTGMDPKGVAILDELKAQHLTADDVHTVLITHGHFDHIAASAVFSKAAIYVGAADVPLMHGEGSPKGPLPRLLNRFMKVQQLPPNLHELKGDEKTLDVGGVSIGVTHVPGHTPGSTMYLYKDILFTGDSLMTTKSGLQPITFLVSDDVDENLRSLALLLPLTFTTVADGHSGLASDAHAKLEALLKR